MSAAVGKDEHGLSVEIRELSLRAGKHELLRAAHARFEPGDERLEVGHVEADVIDDASFRRLLWLQIGRAHV